MHSELLLFDSQCLRPSDVSSTVLSSCNTIMFKTWSLDLIALSLKSICNSELETTEGNGYIVT